MPDVPTTAQRIQPSSASVGTCKIWVESSFGMVSTPAFMAIKEKIINNHNFGATV